MRRSGARSDVETTYRTAALAAAEFQLRHQLREAHSYFLPSVERARGGFRSGLFECEVRIDGVQHNIVALLEALDLIKAVRPRDGKG